MNDNILEKYSVTQYSVNSVLSYINAGELHDNLASNCIPGEIENMVVGDYREFLQERRKLMAKKIREYYHRL